MQGTWVRSLVREDPTCCGATQRVRHNNWACALEPGSRNYWAHVPQLPRPSATTTEACTPRAPSLQQENPLQWEACAPQRRAAPARRNWREPAHSKEDPMQPKINKIKINKFFKKRNNNWERLNLKRELDMQIHKAYRSHYKKIIITHGVLFLLVHFLSPEHGLPCVLFLFLILHTKLLCI